MLCSLGRLQWTDNTVAADWANDLLSRANRFIHERTINETQQSIAFLKAKVEKTDAVELRTAIFLMIQAKVSEAMMASVRQDYAFAIIDPAVEPLPSNRFRRPWARHVSD